MKKLAALIVLVLFSQFAFAELEGYYPRYVFIADDQIIGDTHYVGFSKFSKLDDTYDGYTFRYGKGKGGDRVGMSYTSGIWLMAVDVGVTYMRPDKEKFRSDREGVYVEFGYRFTALYANAVIGQDTSYIGIGFGF